MVVTCVNDTPNGGVNVIAGVPLGELHAIPKYTEFPCLTKMGADVSAEIFEPSMYEWFPMTSIGVSMKLDVELLINWILSPCVPCHFTLPLMVTKSLNGDVESAYAEPTMLDDDDPPDGVVINFPENMVSARMDDVDTPNNEYDPSYVPVCGNMT